MESTANRKVVSVKVSSRVPALTEVRLLSTDGKLLIKDSEVTEVPIGIYKLSIRFAGAFKEVLLRLVEDFEYEVGGELLQTAVPLGKKWLAVQGDRSIFEAAEVESKRCGLSRGDSGFFLFARFSRNSDRLRRIEILDVRNKLVASVETSDFEAASDKGWVAKTLKLSAGSYFLRFEHQAVMTFYIFPGCQMQVFMTLDSPDLRPDISLVCSSGQECFQADSEELLLQVLIQSFLRTSQKRVPNWIKSQLESTLNPWSCVLGAYLLLKDTSYTGLPDKLKEGLSQCSTNSPDVKAIFVGHRSHSESRFFSAPPTLEMGWDMVIDGTEKGVAEIDRAFGLYKKTIWRIGGSIWSTWLDEQNLERRIDINWVQNAILERLEKNVSSSKRVSLKEAAQSLGLTTDSVYQELIELANTSEISDEFLQNWSNINREIRRIENDGQKLALKRLILSHVRECWLSPQVIKVLDLVEDNLRVKKPTQFREVELSVFSVELNERNLGLCRAIWPLFFHATQALSGNAADVRLRVERRIASLFSTRRKVRKQTGRQMKQSNSVSCIKEGGLELRHDQVILNPLITEKGLHRSKHGHYPFRVHTQASKLQIKRAIEKLWQVDVEKVNTLIQKGKSVKYRGKQGCRDNWKKAVVKVKRGQSIPIFLV